MIMIAYEGAMKRIMIKCTALHFVIMKNNT